VSIATQLLSAVRAGAIVVAVGIAVLIGFGSAVYLSLRSSEVKVPDVVGKDRYVAENELTSAGLNFRQRAVRPSNQVKADTILFQLPHAGEVVKAGQTVAVDVSRSAKEGEASDTISRDDNTNTNKANDNSNANTATAGNLNENKPKRNRNGNSNTNGNTNTGNRNANANRPKPNTNAKNGNVSANGNANQGPGANRTGETNNQNSNRANRNANRAKPPAQPTPQN
jgi:hypothetical protein